MVWKLMVEAGKVDRDENQYRHEAFDGNMEQSATIGGSGARGVASIFEAQALSLQSELSPELSETGVSQ